MTFLYTPHWAHRTQHLNWTYTGRSKYVQTQSERQPDVHRTYRRILNVQWTFSLGAVPSGSEVGLNLRNTACGFGFCERCSVSSQLRRKVRTAQLANKHGQVKSTPRAVPQKRCSSSIFIWLGKFEEHLILKKMQIWPTHIWNITLFNRESYVYTTTKWQGFPYKLFFLLYTMQIWLLQKVFPFSSRAGSDGSEQLSWLVKKEHLFQKIKFSNVFISLISVQNIPLSYANKHFFKNVSWGALHRWNTFSKTKLLKYVTGAPDDLFLRLSVAYDHAS